MEQKRLQRLTAIVTGASSGIGKGIAIQLGKEGANVVINFHKEAEEAEDTRRQIESFDSKGLVVQADVSVESDVLKMFEDAKKAFGTIDILVSNSGIEEDKALVDMSLEEWQKVIDVNLTGYFLCAREAAKEFIKRGVVKERSTAAGKIIFISSVHDKIPWAKHANYAASKGGVMLFMQSIAQELAPQKIRVNSISPGAIRTPINKHAWGTPEALNELLKLIPYQRIGEPEDIAKAVAWLASDESDYITGATIYVDGGMTLYPDFASGG